MLGNAAYAIEMPAQWNGELVLWAHGFAGFDTVVTVDPPPAAFRRLMDGDRLRIDGLDWHAIAGYGHAPAASPDRPRLDDHGELLLAQALHRVRHERHAPLAR